MKLSLTFGKRLWLLALMMILGLCLAAGFQAIIRRIDIAEAAQLRIGSVVQQLLMFMLPAVICALMVTRRPAELLGIKSLPRLRTSGLALAVMIVSIPAMQTVVQLGKHLPWPAKVLAAEAANERLVELMMGHGGAANTALALCVIAILPGLCEELFFRGALQNLLQSRPLSVHAAIWITAVVFSAMHMQPVGLIARTLLGAGFGYIALWSGSLWTAIACHMLNNALVVITRQAGADIECIGLSTPALSLASAALTAVGLWLVWRDYSRSMSSGM